MSKIKLAREGQYLKAAKLEDLQEIQKIPEGEMFQVSYQRIRNPKLHRKYFAVIQQVFFNQEFFNNKEELRKFLQIAAGHYQVAYLPKPKTGEVKQLVWPKSIAFHKLDEEEFRGLYKAVLQKAEENFGISAELLDGEVKYE